MPVYLKNVALRLLSIALIFALAACGGGGGGGGGGSSGASFSVSPNSLTFNAASPSSPTPAPQTITITVTSGTVYLGAFHNGVAIANSAFAIVGATTAEVTVYPAAPSSLGTGQHSGSVTIIGCNDQA